MASQDWECATCREGDEALERIAAWLHDGTIAYQKEKVVFLPDGTVEYSPMLRKAAEPATRRCSVDHAWVWAGSRYLQLDDGTVLTEAGGVWSGGCVPYSYGTFRAYPGFREETTMAVQTTQNQPVQIRLRPKPAKPKKPGRK